MNCLKPLLFFLFCSVICLLEPFSPKHSAAQEDAGSMISVKKNSRILSSRNDLESEMAYWRKLISRAKKSYDQWKKEWDLYDRDLASVKAGKADADLFELRWITSGRKKKLLAGLKPYLDAQKTVRASFRTDRDLYAHLDNLAALKKSVSAAVKKGNTQDAEKQIQDAGIGFKMPNK